MSRTEKQQTNQRKQQSTFALGRSNVFREGGACCNTSEVGGGAGAKDGGGEGLQLGEAAPSREAAAALRGPRGPGDAVHGRREDGASGFSFLLFFFGVGWGGRGKRGVGEKNRQREKGNSQKLLGSWGPQMEARFAPGSGVRTLKARIAFFSDAHAQEAIHRYNGGILEVGATTRTEAWSFFFFFLFFSFYFSSFFLLFGGGGGLQFDMVA